MFMSKSPTSAVCCLLFVVMTLEGSGRFLAGLSRAWSIALCNPPRAGIGRSVGLKGCVCVAGGGPK